MKAQKGSKSRLGMEALMWVLNSERPLHTTELCHALGVKAGSPDPDPENIPTIRTLLACALGLITVEASSSTARLVHFSLKEYLSDNPSLFQSPHSMIAEVCLTYLNFRCVRELSPTLGSAPSILPLVGYASSYWGKHVKKGGAGSLAPLALKFLIGFEQHISSRLLLLQYFNDENFWEPDFRTCGPKGFTGLHGAAFFGIVEIVAALLSKKEWDVNATDTMGRTALAWAAIGGHEDVVEIILQQEGANADIANTGLGLAPLWLAAVCGHEGVVKLLLEREDVYPNTPDTEYGATPLLLAAARGHEGVVKFLLKREDINPNTPDTESGRTPLWWTAMSGHEEIAKLLLEREDIDPNTADTKYGRTPLLLAVKNGHEGVVKLLLERWDINPDIRDLNSETALQLAASRGHARVVELLSAPRPSLPPPTGTDVVPPPDPSSMLQNPSQSPPSVSFPRSKPLPSDTRPLLGKAIGSFVIILSLVFLFYSLAVTGPSLSTISSSAFHT